MLLWRSSRSPGYRGTGGGVARPNCYLGFETMKRVNLNRSRSQLINDRCSVNDMPSLVLSPAALVRCCCPPKDHVCLASPRLAARRTPPRWETPRGSLRNHFEKPGKELLLLLIISPAFSRRPGLRPPRGASRAGVLTRGRVLSQAPPPRRVGPRAGLQPLGWVPVTPPCPRVRALTRGG